MKRILFSIACILVIVIFSGCGNSLKLDPQKHPAVMVYPPIDVREVKEPSLEKIESKKVLFKDRFSLAEEMLYNRNLYMTSYLKNPKEAAITYQDLIAADPAKLKTIPSEGMRYALIIVINKFTFKSDITTQSDIGLEGYLIDKKEGTIVWKNSSAKEFGQLNVPVIVPVIAGSMGFWASYTPGSKYHGVSVATANLLDSFPVLKLDYNKYLP